MAKKKRDKKAELQRRIHDMFLGAGGSADWPTEDSIAESMDVIRRWICALKWEFQGQSDPETPGRYEHDHLFREWNLECFESIDTATEHLWSGGVRP